VLIALMALVQAWHADGPVPGDGVICGQFAGLIAALTTVLVLGPAPIAP
jgi:hypothetical protein